jgi:hypothetical protein
MLLMLTECTGGFVGMSWRYGSAQVWSLGEDNWQPWRFIFSIAWYNQSQ